MFLMIFIYYLIFINNRQEFIFFIIIYLPILCSFFELNISTNHHISFIRVVKLISFGLFIIAHKDKFFARHLVWSLIIYIYIANAPKNFQVRIIWLSSIPCFLWSHVIQVFIRTSIWKVDSTIYSFSPKLFRHLLCFEYAFCHVKDASILSLSTIPFCCGDLGTITSLFIP